MSLNPQTRGPESVCIGTSVVRRGSRVRLAPQAFADIYDVALAGRIAIVEGIDRDREDNLHVAVLLDEDAGGEVGDIRRQHGQRFFFAIEDIRPVAEDDER